MPSHTPTVLPPAHHLSPYSHHSASNSQYILSFSFHFVVPRPIILPYMYFSQCITTFTLGAWPSGAHFPPVEHSQLHSLNLHSSSALCLHAGVQALTLTQVPGKQWLGWACASTGAPALLRGEQNLVPLRAGQQVVVHHFFQGAGFYIVLSVK